MSTIIAIDGPAASGKGTLARRLAGELNYAYLDTGALYRSVAKRILDQKDDPENVRAAKQAALWLQDNVTPELLADPAIRLDEVGRAAAKVASIPDVRQALLDLQRYFAKEPGEGYQGAILDGRDIGTVICPNADVKLFVEADIDIRAERRTKELQSKGIETTKAAVLRDMRERDERDMQRQAAPLMRAKDAIVLDTSDLGPDEMFDNALKIIKEQLSS